MTAGLKQAYKVNKLLNFTAVFGGMMAGAQFVQFVWKPDLTLPAVSLPESDDKKEIKPASSA
ncbi:hypothetical protein HDU76_000679 [Blyttiomyces sp. JEL0837]|nr:hypothetical protein HDU76_000679 [Blyttiomyces sp. JEL0837]